MGNMAEKCEIAHFKQFQLFPKCFPEAFLFNLLKLVYVDEKVKPSQVQPCVL